MPRPTVISPPCGKPITQMASPRLGARPARAATQWLLSIFNSARSHLGVSSAAITSARTFTDSS
jgi:hypothetical protein